MYGASSAEFVLASCSGAGFLPFAVISAWVSVIVSEITPAVRHNLCSMYTVQLCGERLNCDASSFICETVQVCIVVYC